MAAPQRKIDNILRGWKANKDKKPLVIKACRQYRVWVQLAIIKNRVLVQKVGEMFG